MISEKLADFLDRHGITPDKENSRSYIFNCPACGGHEKLYIEKANGRSVCFKHKTDECPTSKTGIVRTLMLITDLPYDQIKSELSDTVYTTPEEVLSFEDEIKTDMDKEDVLPVMDSKGLPFDVKPITWPESDEGMKYLLSRGLDKSTMIKYNIMYSPHYRRVIFPVIMNNNIYGWQGRAIDNNNKLRMYNLPGEWKTKTLMFYDNTKFSDKIIIAEGAVSALKFDHVGGFVATMGKIISTKQKEMILNSGAKDIYLALDPDAVVETEELVKYFLMQNKVKVNCHLIKVPQHREDFGDCTYEECVDAFNNSEPLDTGCFNLHSYLTERL